MAKTKLLISFAVTAKLICVFVFAYAIHCFFHDAAHFIFNQHEYCISFHVLHHCLGVMCIQNFNWIRIRFEPVTKERTSSLKTYPSSAMIKVCQNTKSLSGSLSLLCEFCLLYFLFLISTCVCTVVAETLVKAERQIYFFMPKGKLSRDEELIVKKKKF